VLDTLTQIKPENQFKIKMVLQYFYCNYIN
jgi:hypothetical protein